ncbi:hypothetical protein C461_05802 [Halorubrum aidingense JCM 13560]|uniref:Uncharacterized protein n=1 Tax=Halorubrum aidingense JCM 13560 TaxID=1230454 RepID=M0PGD9_9EURY|nr:hypothetical protein C461_05802 [Halorubrum aidingense JCM 13560]
MRPRNGPERPRKHRDAGSSSADDDGRIGRRSRRATTRAAGPSHRAAAERRGTRWFGLFALALPTAAVAGFGALASARVRALASATRGVRSGASPIAAETLAKTLAETLAETIADPTVLRVASALPSELSIVAVAAAVVVGCWAVAIGGAHLVARLLANRRLAGR